MNIPQVGSNDEATTTTTITLERSTDDSSSNETTPTTTFQGSRFSKRVAGTIEESSRSRGQASPHPPTPSSFPSGSRILASLLLLLLPRSRNRTAETRKKRAAAAPPPPPPPSSPPPPASRFADRWSISRRAPRASARVERPSVRLDVNNNASDSIDDNDSSSDGRRTGGLAVATVASSQPRSNENFQKKRPRDVVAAVAVPPEYDAADKNEPPSAAVNDREESLNSATTTTTTATRRTRRRRRRRRKSPRGRREDREREAERALEFVKSETERVESMPLNVTWYSESAGGGAGDGTGGRNASYGAGGPGGGTGPNGSTVGSGEEDPGDAYVLVAEGMYPSGYSLLQIVLAAVAATVLMVVVVVGNMLVIIAIATEKALKNIQNWFIASLAVADFFLGLVIMPFSLANEIMGYWIFGYAWCDVYSAMDVLLCTASIMNLCLISLDRFWSITQAIEYLKRRTPARAALMITLVWLLSALVCIPPLLGWKRPHPAEEYPKCSLSEDIGYVLYSALGSFYVPSCIMVFVYIKIYFAAKARARRGIRKQPRPRIVALPELADTRQTSFTRAAAAGGGSRLTDSINAAPPPPPPPPPTIDDIATIENQPVRVPIVTCDFASDASTSEADPGPEGPSPSLPREDKDTLKVVVTTMTIPMQRTSPRASLSVNGASGSGSGPTRGGDSPAISSLSPPRCRAPSVGIDVDMVSEFDPSSSDSGVASRCAVVKPLKLRLCRPIFGRKAAGKLKREHADPGGHSAKDARGGGGAGTGDDLKPQKPRDPEREKRRLARKKEKRATLILGLIMGSFIVCWLPFFFLYIMKPLFPSIEIPVQASAIAFWLGYMNSALNPVIYTVFNKDFRRAFRRILYK